MKLGVRHIFCASLLVLALGCGETHNDGGEDAAIVFDATFPDAGHDAGPPPSNVGTRCTIDEECAEGGPDSYCERNLGGYCTTYCDDEIPCPHGSTCVNLGGSLNVCLAECDPTAEGDQCPALNGCSSAIPGLPPVCLPGCEDDTDCPDGRMCEVGGGDYGSGACFDPTVEIGAPCTQREDCGANALCADEWINEWPGGSCVSLGCDPEANTGCPDGAVCIALADGGGLCIDECSEEDECRDAYRCHPIKRDEPDGPKGCLPGCTSNDQCSVVLSNGTAYECNPGTGYCTRPFNEAELGNTCSNDFRSCRGGRCMTEAQTGWPGTMCVYPGCSLSGATPSATCPAGSACTEVAGGNPDLGVCAPTCTVGSDEDSCRSGYTCVPLGDEGDEGVCRPGCTTEICSGSRVCNTEPGLCERESTDS